MGVLLAFAVGYVVGARAGSERYQEVVDAASAVRDSSEFQALVAALRSHASFVLTELGQRLAPGAEEPVTMQEVLARVRSAVRPNGAASPSA
ncbi:MAG TPA: hypothetical protein VE991_10175 [Acidimicrobiales bacterium]|nr:hypothetical protein [Acidimicrobiales bacterium]